MTWRRAIAYWVCFLVLGIYYVAVEREAATPAAAHLTRAPFLSISDNQVEALELRRGDTVVRCGKVADRWRVIEPAGRTVAADLLAALITNLSQLPDVEVVSETSSDLAQFGLDPPVSLLVLTLTGSKPITIRLGNRNPSGTAVYAQRSGSPQVFLVGLNVRYYEDLVFEAVRG